MKRTREEVLKIIEGQRDKLKSFGVRRLGLFGLAVRGEADEGSDLDFLVDLEHHTFDAYMDLKFFLEELFGCKVDLVLPDTLKPRLKGYIMQEVVFVPGL
jgi:predicted nucleotidyltransferase